MVLKRPGSELPGAVRVLGLWGWGLTSGRAALRAARSDVRRHRDAPRLVQQEAIRPAGDGDELLAPVVEPLAHRLRPAVVAGDREVEHPVQGAPVVEEDAGRRLAPRGLEHVHGPPK